MNSIRSAGIPFQNIAGLVASFAAPGTKGAVPQAVSTPEIAAALPLDFAGDGSHLLLANLTIHLCCFEMVM
jgi:hypothetical protein